MFGVRLVNGRANLLSAGDLLSDAALDKYSFVRNAYLQRRQALSGGDAAVPVYDDQGTATAAAPASQTASAPAAASMPSVADAAVAASATSAAAATTAPVPLSGPTALPGAPASDTSGGAMNNSEVPPLWHYFPGLRLK